MRPNSKLVAKSLALCMAFSSVCQTGSAQAFSGDDAKKWDAGLDHARSLRDEKKFDQALKALADLQAQAEGDGDKKRVRKAVTASAAAYFYNKQFAKAEELDRQALGMAEASNNNDGAIALCLNDLAETLVEEGRFDEALPIIKRSVAISEQVFSHNHPLLGVRLNFLADLLERMGKKSEAAAYRSEAQGIINSFMAVMTRKIKGAWMPPRCGYSYSNNVGFEVLDHGVVTNVHIIDSSGNKANDDAAVAAVEKAQPFLDISSTADDDQLLLSFKFDYNYQSHKGSAKKDSDAQEDQEEQATAGREPSKDTDVLIAKEREHLTEVLAKIAQIKKDPARKDTDLAEAYGDLTHTLKVMGEHQQAVKYLKEALNLADFHSKKNPATLMVLCDLGSVYLTSKKADLAESTLKEVVESPIFTEIPDSNVKQQALDDLGHALCALGHYAEAQKYYSRKHDIN